MSLLLEALKKAEKAKEEAQRRATRRRRGEQAAFDPEATVLDDGKHVTRRDRTARHLRAAGNPQRRPALRHAAKAAPLELALAEEPAPAPEAKTPPRRANRRAQAEASNAERITARKVFEAKVQRAEPAPALLHHGRRARRVRARHGGLFLGPAAPAAVAREHQSGSRRGREPAAAAPAAAPATGLGQASQGPGAIPACRRTPLRTDPPLQRQPQRRHPRPLPRRRRRAASRRRARDAPRRRGSRPRRPRSTPAAASTESGRSPSTAAAPQVHPQVSAGYAAYQAGDLRRPRAATTSRRCAMSPRNRDALLGLAAVEMRAQRYELADGYVPAPAAGRPARPARAGRRCSRCAAGSSTRCRSRAASRSLLAADPRGARAEFHARQPVRAAGALGRSAAGVFQGLRGRPGQPGLRLQPRRQPRPPAPAEARARVLPARAGAGARSAAPTSTCDSARTRVQQLTR